MWIVGRLCTHWRSPGGEGTVRSTYYEGAQVRRLDPCALALRLEDMLHAG